MLLLGYSHAASVLWREPHFVELATMLGQLWFQNHSFHGLWMSAFNTQPLHHPICRETSLLSLTSLPGHVTLCKLKSLACQAGYGATISTFGSSDSFPLFFLIEQLDPRSSRPLKCDTSTLR